MPELPEVETIRRQLEPLVKGRVIEEVTIIDKKIVSPSSATAFRRQVSGRRIMGVTRRGKYLCFMLDGGDTLVLHLRMTGRLTHCDGPPTSDARLHLRMVIHLDDGSCLAFHDSRRFGRALVLQISEEKEYWGRLGTEPLSSSFTPEKLAVIAHERRKPIKPLLMDQSLIAGIGNIYADEALFQARIHPLRPSSSLSDMEIKRLHQSVRDTLKTAIGHGGSSIDSYVNALGEQGNYQEILKVHRRLGEPCPICGGLIEKIKVGGRGTYICPQCQKL